MSQETIVLGNFFFCRKIRILCACESRKDADTKSKTKMYFYLLIAFYIEKGIERI